MHYPFHLTDKKNSVYFPRLQLVYGTTKIHVQVFPGTTHHIVQSFDTGIYCVLDGARCLGGHRR